MKKNKYQSNIIMNKIKFLKYRKKYLEMIGGKIDKIIDYIYLGTIDDVNQIDLLNRLDIKHVISVGEFPRIKSEDVQYYTFDIVDLYGSYFPTDPNEDDSIHKRNMERIIEEAYEIIERAVQQRENILIHCRSAISRSPTVLAGYLMKKYNYTFDRAKDIIMAERDIKNGEFLWRDVLEKNTISPIRTPILDVSQIPLFIPTRRRNLQRQLIDQEPERSELQQPESELQLESRQDLGQSRQKIVIPNDSPFFRNLRKK